MINDLSGNKVSTRSDSGASGTNVWLEALETSDLKQVSRCELPEKQ